MNQYLLLRDNKQSGPYTTEELVSKGLKPYDLVWVEGKSAAWRYPSEIAELKPYAPVVEEQPYDRFYKKPAAETHPQLEQESKAITKEIPAYQASYTGPEDAGPVKEHTPPAIHPKKIYVTLPSANAHTGSEAEAPTSAAQTPSFSQKLEASLDAPAPAKAAEKKVDPAPVIAINESVNPANKVVNNENTLSDTLYQMSAPRIGRSSRGRIMTGLVAACLLLFGVVIGLAISNYRQQSYSRTLEDQVRIIQEKEKNKQATTETPSRPPASDYTGLENNPGSDKAAADEELKEPSTDVPVSIASKKERITPPVKESQLPPAVPTSNTVIDPDIKANTAILDENKGERITYQQAIESARKNIHQMVLVESSKFKTGILGGISDLRLTLSNNSRFPLDEVEIEIRYFGPENKLVKKQKLLFNDLAPGEQKTLEAPRSNRGVTIDYSITHINSQVLGLAKAHTDFHN